MSEVSLRSYLHEIEKHIESGRLDQAIAHSRHILQSYPKCVDAYRLLAQAFLESQRYTDANDIFQRVLSTIPDDFVSHLGMSLIREDEGNLDEAIWHMERAFEVQPSNNAVQVELRRLFGRRDHVEPPKIRLTRGALARLYHRGELYQQAISEIRSSLAEDPNRLDLQALLSEIYLKNEQLVEAADMALAVLKRLPNCFVANQVMAGILQGTNRKDELAACQERIAEIDPYMAFASGKFPDVKTIPDHMVRIEKLDWKPDPNLRDTSQPAWAASLGVDLDELTAEHPDILPEWLEEETSEPEFKEEKPGELPDSAFVFKEELSETSTKPEEENKAVPDWLKDAGWLPPVDLETESDLESLSEQEFDAIEREIEPDSVEFPDWLQALEPPEKMESPPSDEGDFTPWLDELMAADEAGEIESSDLQNEPSTIPDWLMKSDRELQNTEEDEPIEADSESGTGSPFKETIEPEFPQPGEPQPLSEGSGVVAGDRASSDWLQPFQDEFIEGLLEDNQPDDDFFDWAEEPVGDLIQQESETPAIEAGDSPALHGEIPDWLLEDFVEEPEIKKGGDTIESTDQAEEESEWFSGLDLPTAEHGAQGFEKAVELPDWLDEETGESDQNTAEEAVEPALEEAGELPDWLDEETDQSDQNIAEEAGELPDWMKESEPIHAEADQLGEEVISEHPEWELEVEEPPTSAETEIEAETGDELDLGGALDEVGPIDEEAAALEEAILGDTQPTRIERKAENAGAAEKGAFIFDELPEPPELGSTMEEMQTAAPKDPLDEAFAWLMSLHSTAEQPVETDEVPLIDMEEVIDETSSTEEVSQEDWLAAPEKDSPIPADIETIEGTPFISEPESEFAEELQETEGEDTLPPHENTEIPSIRSELISAEEEIIDEEAALTWLEGLGVHTDVGEASASETGEQMEAVSEGLEEDVRVEESALPEEPARQIRYDLNLASLSQIESLPGIGLVTAQRIIEYREQHGAFLAIEDLLRIPGFGLMTLDGVRNHLYVESSRSREEFSAETIEEIVDVASSEALTAARLAFTQGDLRESMALYARLISANQEMALVAHDLEEAAVQFPNDMELWQNLGDAYLRLERVQEALNAYARAEQLLQ